MNKIDYMFVETFVGGETFLSLYRRVIVGNATTAESTIEVFEPGGEDDHDEDETGWFHIDPDDHALFYRFGGRRNVTTEIHARTLQDLRVQFLVGFEATALSLIDAAILLGEPDITNAA